MPREWGKEREGASDESARHGLVVCVNSPRESQKEAGEDCNVLPSDSAHTSRIPPTLNAARLASAKHSLLFGLVQIITV